MDNTKSRGSQSRVLNVRCAWSSNYFTAMQSLAFCLPLCYTESVRKLILHRLSIIAT